MGCGGCVAVAPLAAIVAGLSRGPGDNARAVGGSSPNRDPKLESRPDYSDRDSAIVAECATSTVPRRGPSNRRSLRDSKTFCHAGIRSRGKPITFQRNSKSNTGFSPLEETRIVPSGNRFRIKGWFRANGIHWGEQVDYTCEMRFDPELEVWKLVGHVEEVDH